MEQLLARFTNSHLHRIRGLLGGWALGLLFIAAIDLLITKIIGDVYLRFALYLAGLLIWTLYWEHNRSCSRKTAKGKVGIVISIFAEKIHEEERLRADFISRLQNRIQTEELSDTIDIVVLKNHIAKHVQTNAAITKINKRVGGRYYVFGNIKRRNNPNSTYFLNLNGVVFHVPLNNHNKRLLVRDMDSVLLKQVAFPEAMEFQGFQYTADNTYIGVKYITGLAAYVSGNPNLARQLHTKLETELAGINPLPPNLIEVKSRIPNLLSDEALFEAREKLMNGELQETKDLLAYAFEKNPINYPAALVQSVVDFLHDRDAPKALARLKKALKHREKDSTIFYNLAFLQFWTGDYSQALKSCDKILKSNDDDSTAIESQEFNEGLLEQGNLKPQLYFWLGFLNYRKRRNFPLADKYFQVFLSIADQNMNALVDRTHIYMEEIKEEIGY